MQLAPAATPSLSPLAALPALNLMMRATVSDVRGLLSQQVAQVCQMLKKLVGGAP